MFLIFIYYPYHLIYRFCNDYVYVYDIMCEKLNSLFDREMKVCYVIKC